MKKKHYSIAPESDKIRRAREKLQKRLLSENHRITPDALALAIMKIHYRIERNSEERLSLKEKSITLFDGNKNAASPQQPFIQRLRQQIHAELQNNDKELSNLRGRIKT